MREPTTLAVDLQDLHTEIQQTFANSKIDAAINWSNVKALIAQLLDKWGPMILPIIITWLSPKTEPK